MACGAFLWGNHRLAGPANAEDSLSGDSIVPSGQRVLRKGQDCFRSIEEYLSLFGIPNGDTAYFRPLPGHDLIYVWGP